MARTQEVTCLPAAIKAWRRERGMSQANLAKKAGCSEGLIAQIETGRRQPGIVNALGIAAALGVPIGAIGTIHVDLAALDVEVA